MQFNGPVSSCSICGLDFPESELSRHYRTGRLVDALCLDEQGASDYMSRTKRRAKRTRHAKQPIDSQGYISSDWASISFAQGLDDATASVFGNERGGILTIATHVSTLALVVINITLPHVPTLYTLSSAKLYPHNDVASAIPGIYAYVVGNEIQVLNGSVVLAQYTTYEWRYESKLALV